MRIMCLDVRDERIALSDETALLASPREVIAQVPGAASYLRLAEIVRQEGVARIVVGLPLLPDGGQAGLRPRLRARPTEAMSTCPWCSWDERHSTNGAHDIAAHNRPRPARPAGRPASVILQDYLDHLRGGPHECPLLRLLTLVLSLSVVVFIGVAAFLRLADGRRPTRPRSPCRSARPTSTRPLTRARRSCSCASASTPASRPTRTMTPRSPLSSRPVGHRGGRHPREATPGGGRRCLPLLPAEQRERPQHPGGSVHPAPQR